MILSHALEETSNRKFYQAVIDSIVASENIEINGSDDSDINENIPNEFRKAVSTINRYTDGLNDPIARKFEKILSSFSRLLRLEETKSMKEISLTDFCQSLRILVT